MPAAGPFPRFVSVLLFHEAVQEGYNLRAGAGGVGAEGIGAHPRRDALGSGPGHRVGIPGAVLHVGKAAALRHRRGTGGPVQEGHGLAPGHRGIGRKAVLAHAGGDPLLHGPQDRSVEVVALLHVCEGVPAAGRLGSARRLPQEGDDLRAGTGHIRAEGAGAGARGDAVLHRPLHRLGVPGVGRHVREGHIGQGGVGVFDPGGEDCADGVPLPHILKGIAAHRAYAPAVCQHIGDLIALLGTDGEGLAVAPLHPDSAAGADAAALAGGGGDGVPAGGAAAGGTAVIGLLGLLNLSAGQLVYRHGAGDLTGGQEQILAGVVLPGRDKGQALGGHVAAGNPLVQ